LPSPGTAAPAASAVQAEAAVGAADPGSAASQPEQVPEEEKPLLSEAAPGEPPPEKEAAVAEASAERSPPESPAVAEEAPSPPPPAKVVKKEPNNPRVLCGPRTQFSLYRCMREACERPKYYDHPECKYLRVTDKVRTLP